MTGKLKKVAKKIKKTEKEVKIKESTLDDKIRYRIVKNKLMEQINVKDVKEKIQEAKEELEEEINSIDVADFTIEMEEYEKKIYKKIDKVFKNKFGSFVKRGNRE